MGQHPITRKKNTHAKKPRQRLGKTDGLSNKQQEYNYNTKIYYFYCTLLAFLL